MRKLLSADFSRLWKDKIFWIETLFMFGLGIWAAYGRYSYRYDEFVRLDDALFAYAPFIGCCSAIFCSMFSGTEYSDGTIRNKLIVGHLRSSIYLSNYLTSIAATMIIAAAFLFSYCALGFFLLASPEAPLGIILSYLFVSLFTMIAYVSLFNMLSMLISMKSVSAVLCLVIFIGLFIAALTIEGKLDAPEFVSGYSLTVNGIEMSEPSPNPKYLQPDARKVYEFFRDVLPTGQGIQLSAVNVLHPFLITVYATVTSAATSVIGMLIFKKKDLK